MTGTRNLGVLVRLSGRATGDGVGRVKGAEARFKMACRVRCEGVGVVGNGGVWD